MLLDLSRAVSLVYLHTRPEHDVKLLVSHGKGEAVDDLGFWKTVAEALYDKYLQDMASMEEHNAYLLEEIHRLTGKEDK